MMSVLVKGMKMPEGCARCQLFEGEIFDGLCHGANKWLDDDHFRWYQFAEGDVDDSKPINCPLIEVPETHGRLIDADAAAKQGWTISRTYSASPNQMVYEVKAMTDEILPTIIPAEEEGET